MQTTKLGHDSGAELLPFTNLRIRLTGVWLEFACGRALPSFRNARIMDIIPENGNQEF